MPRSASLPLLALLALLVALAALPACAASGTGTRANGPPPVYAEPDRQLFDDTIDPRAVGYELDLTSSPSTDARLRERAQLGDATVRARVTTVSSKNEDRGTSWTIGLRTVERLAGNAPLAADFTVSIGPTSPSAGILRAWDGRLIGMAFVVFVRAFARPDSPGDIDLHFHIAPDTKDEAAAVRAAVAPPVR